MFRPALKYANQLILISLIFIKPEILIVSHCHFF